MRKKLYIAYGSNLNQGQMAWRCPTARYVGTGMIEGYELKFKGRPNGAYATIDPKKGGTVPVAIWEIQPYDEFRLNQYEGYPNNYFTKNIPVKIGNQEVTGMVYIMNLQAQANLPSKHYYDTVEQGYKDCGLDIAYLKAAKERSKAEMAERKSTFTDDWKEDETDDEDWDLVSDEIGQNDSGADEDSRADLADWFGNSDEPDDDIDEDEDEGYAQSPLHF